MISRELFLMGLLIVAVILASLVTIICIVMKFANERSREVNRLVDLIDHQQQLLQSVTPVLANL